MALENALAISYATAAAPAVAALVSERYDLRGKLVCALQNRGFNDTYVIYLTDGARFILRVSGRRGRGPADVAAETAFLAHLDGEGVPVAAAVPTREGKLFTSATLPDGPRAAVLFRFADGRRPDLDTPEDARLQGITLARIHTAADGFPARARGRYRLDLDHLLHRQVRSVRAAVRALGLDATRAIEDVHALAERLANAVQRIDGDLTRTRCHGDCHGLNARIATAGPHAGEAVFFDFDDGGYGYLAYDLAVHLWAQVSFGRRRYAMWHAFIAGYRTTRQIRTLDAEAVHLFVPIRHIWLMGEWASRMAEWGAEYLTAAWLEREVAFMLTWERDRLETSLLTRAVWAT